MNTNEWEILDRKALATLRLSLTPQVAFNISKEETTTVGMQALEKLYEKPSTSNKNPEVDKITSRITGKEVLQEEDQNQEASRSDDLDGTGTDEGHEDYGVDDC
ncbi:hypothetical protein RJ639_030811 [Escallonia herrerae]|uniref:Uncharacterized protein n=1 Tax=Escallonia herrerae TaxID=1293975 RepID=A0AA89BMA5_9ASTE|nr:hypothetical protein RJ639_030811 [Escallonia herrerae]